VITWEWLCEATPSEFLERIVPFHLAQLRGSTSQRCPFAEDEAHRAAGPYAGWLAITASRAACPVCGFVPERVAADGPRCEAEASAPIAALPEWTAALLSLAESQPWGFGQILAAHRLAHLLEHGLQVSVTNADMIVTDAAWQSCRVSIPRPGWTVLVIERPNSRASHLGWASPTFPWGARISRAQLATRGVEWDLDNAEWGGWISHWRPTSR
jgi:hypothetical protein